MNKTISEYVKTCDLDTLYNLFELVVKEINHRKEKEQACNIK